MKRMEMRKEPSILESFDVEKPSTTEKTPEVSTAADTATSTNTPSKRTSKTVARPKKRSKINKWSPDTVTTDEKSPLAVYNIKNILLDPMAWVTLSPEVQASIVKLAPPGMFVQQPDDGTFQPDYFFLRSNGDFLHGCTVWQEDLVAGKNDPAWQQDALRASQRRSAGDFDEYKEKHMEEYWGQKKDF